MQEIQNKDGTGDGMSAIVNVLIRNPGAALQIVIGIVGLLTIYFTMQGSIAELKASAVRDHADTISAVTDMRATQGTQSAQAKLDLAEANNRVAALDQRGTQRYGEIKDSISQLNTKVSRVDVNVEWLIRQFETGGVGNPRPFPDRGPNGKTRPAPASNGD